MDRGPDLEPPVRIIDIGDRACGSLMLHEGDMYFVCEGEVFTAPLSLSTPLRSLAHPRCADLAGVHEGYAYWADCIAEHIARVALAGGEVEVVVEDLLLERPDGIQSIELGPTHLYWSTWNNIVRWPLAGGSAERMLLPRYGGFSSRDLALDADSLYFAYHTDGDLARVPLDGGSTTILTDGAGNVNALALDADNLYWVDNQGVALVPLAGSSMPRPLWDNPEFPLGGSCHDVAVDRTHVYWTQGDTVWRVPIAGGASTPLTWDRGEAQSIVLTDTHIYWTTWSGDIWRMRK